MHLQPLIDRLEHFSALHGVAVSRTTLSPWVVGRMDARQIVLRSGLSKEQQLLTLIHELTHVLAHGEAQLDRTVCEYEAEAVERLVAGQLGLKDATGAAIDLATVTDDLLACSVTRVRHVARILLGAVQGLPTAAPDLPIAAHRLDRARPPDRLEAQSPIQI